MKPFRSICRLLLLPVLPAMATAKSSRSRGEVKIRARGRYAASFACADVALRSEGTGSWKVSRDEFYATLAETLDECSIFESDSRGYESGSAPIGMICDGHVGDRRIPE